MADDTAASETGAVRDEEIVGVATFNTPLEADLIQSELGMAGIESWVANGTIAQTLLTMPDPGFIVEVRASDAARAEEVISGRADAAENVEQVTDDFVPDTLTASDDAEAGG